MINENKLGRSVVMNYTLMHKNIKVADLSLDEENPKGLIHSILPKAV